MYSASRNDEIGEMRRLADRMAGLDPSELNDTELAVDLVAFRRQLDRMEAVYTRLARAAECRGIGLEDGARSTAAWISWKTGRVPAAVHHTLKVGEVCELLPRTAGLWAAGEITTPAVEAIAAARVAHADEQLIACEDDLLEPALRRDHRSLRVMTRHFRECALADGSRPAPTGGLTISNLDGRTVLNGEAYGTTAETITHAIHTFMPPPVEGDTRTSAERRLDAFERICEIALGRGTDAEPARPAVTYFTHQTVDGVQALTIAGFTGVISPADRDRILCDCDLTEIALDELGLPASIGKATGTWTTSTRKAIVARDGHCQFPGCDLPAAWTDLHHVVHREHGGPSTHTNGVCLCRKHHTFLHRNPRWTTTFEHQRFRVYRPDGTELDPDPWHDDVPNAEPSGLMNPVTLTLSA